MAQYIDKSALVAEIDRLREEKGTFYASDVLYNLEDFLDTLEVEEVGQFVSNDLEEEITRCIVDEDMNFAEVARHFAQWQKQQDQSTIELAEDHAYLAGQEKVIDEAVDYLNSKLYDWVQTTNPNQRSHANTIMKQDFIIRFRKAMEE